MHGLSKSRIVHSWNGHTNFACIGAYPQMVHRFNLTEKLFMAINSVTMSKFGKFLALITNRVVGSPSLSMEPNLSWTYKIIQL